MLLDRTPDWTEWMYVAAPFQIYAIIVIVLVCYGDHGDERNAVKQFFRRISTCLERWTGYAGWAMAGGLSALLVLGSVAIGLYWDVGYHVDFGRDQQLFTPSHTMIVLGLGGLAYAALIAVIFASLDHAPVGFRVGGLRVPWTALALAAFGIGGLAAFPLDAWWHEVYGIDVTLWSPSHLQLLGGGSLATILLWLMAKEGGASHPTLLGRGIVVTYMGAVLTGMSTFQGEFDFGVPQFQVVYLPILIGAAAGFSLVLARLVLGRWGAVKTVIAFLLIRGVLALLVGGPFNLTVPWFPLYVVAALAVEGAARWLGTENRLRFALASGAAVGTLGVTADLAWLSLLNDVDPSLSGLPKALLLSTVAALGAALLGGAMARPVPGGRVPAVAAVAGGLALLATLAYPLPRNVGDVDAVVRLRPAGDGLVTVDVALDPPDAAEHATAFGIVAWQGGGRVSAALDQVAPGRYVSSKPVPVTGRWKTVVGLQRGDEVMAVPVYLPADPEINAPEIPAVPERQAAFVRNTKLLLRESRDGPQTAAQVAYSGVAAVTVVWVGLFALCAVKLSRAADEVGVRVVTRPRPTAPTWDAPPLQPQPAGDGRYSLEHHHIVGATRGDTALPD